MRVQRAGAINKTSRVFGVSAARRTKPFQRQITMQIAEMRARPKIIYFARRPGYNFPYLSGSGNFPFARGVYTQKYIHTHAAPTIYIFIYILMRVSPSCLFIKNGFLSFSLSCTRRRLDCLTFCVFLLEIRRVRMMKTAFLWRSSITQNCPRTCTPSSSSRQFRAKKNG